MPANSISELKLPDEEIFLSQALRTLSWCVVDQIPNDHHLFATVDFMEASKLIAFLIAS